ncbi:MAG TPA: biotin transporter BioY [Actinomycetota bacterium]
MTALAQSLVRSRGAARLAVDAGLVLAGSLVVAALAQVSITLPFTPVPVTGQTLGVLVIGTALGWRLAIPALALYLAEIAVGLPFAAEGKAGVGTLTLSTPSAGYLWGFLAAAALMGWLANRGWDRSLRSSISLMLLGTIVIYAAGIPWLHNSTAFASFIGHDPTIQDTLTAGLYPFIIGDLIKLLIAAGILPAAWRLAGKR